LSNGIVTYVANIRLGLTALGVGSGVVANHIALPSHSTEESDVVDASHCHPPLRLRLLWKAGERLGGMSTLDRRLGAAVGAALRISHARAPLDLFEMEESFGGTRWPVYPWMT
jgi:hypothetical protein